MMGDRVVDINVATVEELETLVGVGRAKAEAIVTTRNSVVEFSSIDDLLLVPGIGKSLLEQNRGVLVCSIPGGAPITRHSAFRRSLRRASQDVRLRGDLVKLEDSSGGEGLGNLTVCASSQAVKPARNSSSIREQNSQYENAERVLVEQPCNTPAAVACRGKLELKEKVKVDNTEGREEITLKEVEDLVQEDTSDYCDCCINEDLEEQDEADDDFIDVPLIDNDNDDRVNEVDGDDPVDIMSSDELGNTGPVVKINSDSRLYNSNSARSDHTCGESVVGGGLGTDTPHEEVPPDVPLKIPSLASQQLTDGEDSEGEELDEEELDKEEEEGQMEECGAEEESDECMTVDPPSSPHTDKKQIKRKSEVCSDTKGVCPVKKSCKAVENG
ncbi:hypothetical protein SK128_003576 [Halocaridina rubra]|uniref:Uncharacterized protein n=1 Tax=Halocaridina rubra TaxID=373956 RepID=A0AAN8WQ13_HALRR